MAADKAKVGTVARLVLYPVKSMRGIDVQEAQCSVNGPQHGRILDRHWVVVAESGVTITARQKPRMSTIQPSFHGDTMHLDAQGVETLKVPVDIPVEGADVRTFKVTDDEIVGVDCGQEAGQWLSKFLEKEGLRLLYAAPGLKRRRLKDRKDVGSLVRAEDEVAYPDLFPTMMLGDASVQELNGRLEKSVSINQFRPNIIVKDTGKAFAEDVWKDISVGECDFSPAMPCPRCIMTTVNPETGTKDPDMQPLRTLRQYRLLVPEFEQSPCFGVYLLTQKAGTVRVGDTIAASLMTGPP